MKVIVKAGEEVDTHYGDTHLKAKAGETLALSPRHAEVALATGKFTFVKQVSESEAESELLSAQNADAEARRAGLMEKPHGELFEMAKDLEGVKKSMTKAELIDEMLKPRAPVTVDTDQTAADNESE